MAKPLSERQSILYTYVVDLWKPTLSDDNTGKVTVSYGSSPTYTSIACYRDPKPRATEPKAFGRQEQDTPNIEDGFHWAEEQDISDLWIIYRPLTHEFWIVHGYAQAVPKGTDRDEGRVETFALFLKNPPAALKTYYGL